MSKLLINTCLQSFCLAVSLLGHTFLLSSIGLFGRLDFATPVPNLPVVIVDLKDRGVPMSERPDASESRALEDPDDSTEPQSVREEASRTDTASVEMKENGAMPAPEPIAAVAPVVQNQTEHSSREDVTRVSSALKQTSFELDPPLRVTGEFLGTIHEKLVYRISLLGLPVGSAELEANNVKGEVRITLRVRSDTVLSTIYPVDDLIETRHINGNFILTRIRQQEGSFRGDRGFTIFLRDKSVFWINRLTNRSVKEPLPNSEVLDILSGLYFLRNRPLQVGTAETLHIYDSESYASIPVNVIRRETVTLPAFREVEALLVQPQMKTGGIFRRTGDVQIWLSDNRYKVPVKIVTSIALGQVTIELMSAESKQPDNRLSQ
jgi:uncharacterized protein DUF3108